MLIDRCSHERAGDRVMPLGPERKAMIRSPIDGLSDRALRTTAIAYRPLPGAEPRDASRSEIEAELERDLVFAGVVGIIDPPRPEAAAAVAISRAAGVRTIMITGAHPRTAERIASSLGIVPEGARVITGLEFDRPLATLFALDLKLPGGFIEGAGTVTEARTTAFTVLVLAQLLLMHSTHAPSTRVPSSASASAPCSGRASGPRWPVLWVDKVKKLIVRTVMRNRQPRTGA